MRQLKENFPGNIFSKKESTFLSTRWTKIYSLLPGFAHGQIHKIGNSKNYLVFTINICKILEMIVNYCSKDIPSP